MAQIRSKQISDFLSTITWSNITSSNNVTIANAWDIKQGFDLVDDSVDSLEAYISAEVVSLEAIDAGLASDIATEKGRVDAILASADADKDSFAEIVSLINAVDTESDDAFAAYVLKANASIDSLEVADTSLETAIADEIRRATSEEARIEGKLDTEIAATNGEVTGINASIDSLEGDVSSIDTRLGSVSGDLVSSVDSLEVALSNEIAATNGEVTGINASIDSLEIVDADIIAKLSANDTDNANLTASVNSLEVVDAGLASDIATEAGRIDAILLSADADKDSFAEIVSLINAVDTESDDAFAAYVLKANASIDSLEVADTSLETAIADEIRRATSEEARIEGKLDTEIAATNGEVTGINASIDSLEGDVSSIDTRLGSVSGDLVSSVDSLEVALSNEIAATDIEVSELKASVQSLETVDGSLETKIDGEITRAGSVETVLSDALAAEITRAGSVETVLSDALAAEITATNGDVTELEASIDSLEIQVASGATYERQNAVFVSRNVFNVAVPVLFGANDDLAVYVNGVFVDFLSPDGITFDFTGLLAYDVDVNDKVQVMGVRA